MIVIYQHTDTKCIADYTFPSKQREIKYINIAQKKVSTMRIDVYNSSNVQLCNNKLSTTSRWIDKLIPLLKGKLGLYLAFQAFQTRADTLMLTIIWDDNLENFKEIILYFTT